MGITYADTLEREIVLGYSEVEFFPYQMGNGITVADPPGISLAIINQAAKELGVSITYRRLPNPRIHRYLKKGVIDGAFVFSFKKSRMENGQFPMKNGKLDNDRNMVTVSYYLYKKKGSLVDWDGQKVYNLQGGSLGANSGFSIVGDLRNKGVKVTEAKTTEQNLMKLKLGRIEGYAAQAITTDHHVMSGKYGEIVKVPNPLATKNYYIMFSYQFMEKHSDIAEQLWQKSSEICDSIKKELLPKYKPVSK